MKRDQLLQNVAFVRTLSRHLVRDPDLGDEIEQRTLTAALSSSPRREASTRSWLSAIARNAARRLGLSEARRRRRESAVARPEALPAADEVAQRREMIHRVIEEVFALEEPYRSTVLARFYDELPPREIARRQGVSVETVRTRLKRALLQLRARLDAEYGSHREWAVVLLPLGAPSGGGVPGAELRPVEWVARCQEAMAMLFTSKASVTVLSAVLIGMIGWGLMESEGGDPAELLPPALSVGEASSASVAKASSPGGVASTSLAAAARPSVPPTPPSTEETATGSLTVHAVWADGTPAASIGVVLGRRASPFTGNASYYDLQSEGVTDSDGRIVFGDLPPGSYRAQADRGDELGALIDVAAGESQTCQIQLSTGAEIEGLVVDEAGQPVAGAGIWLAFRSSPRFTRTGDVAVSDGSGRFRLLGVQPDHVIGARSNSLSPSRGVVIGSLPPTEEGEPDVVLELGGAAGAVAGVVADSSGEPIPGATVFTHDDSGRWSEEADELRPDGRRLVSLPGHFARTDAEGRFRLGGVAPHEVLFTEAMALGRAPWEKHLQIRAGEVTQVDIRLMESPRVFGRVTNERGEPVPNVPVTWNSERYSLETQTQGRSDADGRYQLYGIPVGTPVRVFARSFHSGPTTSVELAPGEELEWKPVVPADGTTTAGGRVTDARGEALPDWVVRYQTSLGAVRADGGFQLRSVHIDSPFPLLVCTPLGFPAQITPWVEPGDQDIEITVEDSSLPTAWVTGRVTGSVHRFEDDVQLAVKFDRQIWPRWRHQGRVPFSVELGEAFRFGPIPPGEYELELRAEGLPPMPLGKHEVSANLVLDVGEVELREPGFLEVLPAFDDGTAPRKLSMSLRSERGALIELASEEGRHYTGLIHPGSYELRWEGRGVESGSQTVEVPAGEPVKLEIPLRRAAVVAIHVWLPESAEIAAIEDEEERRSALVTAFGKSYPTVRVLDEESTRVVEGRPLIPFPNDGNFYFETSLPAGQYLVELETVTGLHGSAQLLVGAPEEAREPVDVVLR